MLQSAIVESRVIPNGVDLSIFSPGDKRTARRDLGLDEDAWISLFVGNGVIKNKFKDFDTLANAMIRLGNHNSKLKHILLCLGEKGERRQIGTNLIQFVDYQTDLNKIAQFYHASDVYLHASCADTFPTTILEALACGTPVIATAVGGIPEQIEDGVTGFLVPSGDSGAMADRIRQLQNDVTLRRMMGMCAVDVARRRFSLERMVVDYLDLYDKILTKSSKDESF